ncbi:MAG: HEAT repeat domain-containing protein [Planctomycetes bacterium]|nr:HEAT repeat domain-containing protein [Planctomycetota bacterium]
MPTRSLALAAAAFALLAAPSPAQTFNGRTASEWVADLAAEDDTTRDYAVWALGQMGERAVRATIRALDDERPRVRRAAAQALARLGALAGEAKDALLARREDADAAVAHAARVALLHVQVDAAQVPALIDELQADDWDCQLAAAEVLAELGPPAAAAARALAGLLTSTDVRLDRTIVHRLERTPPESWNVRAAAARALGSFGPVDGVPIVEALLHCLGNDQWAAREGAAQALVAFPDRAAETAARLIAVLRTDPEWPCRRAAASTLLGIAVAESPALAAVATAMASALKDQDGGVRRIAAEFLGERGGASATTVPALEGLLARPTAKDVMNAANALCKLGPAAPAARSALLQAFVTWKDRDRYDAKEARTAILEALAVVAPDARGEVPELEALLAEREKPKPSVDEARQTAITEAMEQLRAPSRTDRARAMNTIAMLRAQDAIPTLETFLDGDRIATERAMAIQVLMLLDAESIVPRVRPLLDASDPELRRAAAAALAMFSDAESLERTTIVLAEAADVAPKDDLWMLGLMRVSGLAPVMERIASDPREPFGRRWGATTALTCLRVKESAPSVAAMIEAIGKDESLHQSERMQLLAAGLRALVALDPEPHREIFRAHLQSEELEVTEAALHGLAALGDRDALAKRLAESPSERFLLELPAADKRRLESVRLRLSQVKGCTLREVIARLGPALGVTIELSPQVDPKVLDGHFGNYIDFLGFHPSALEILGAMGSMALFSGEPLDPQISSDVIRLVPREAPRDRLRK